MKTFQTYVENREAVATKRRVTMAEFADLVKNRIGGNWNTMRKRDILQISDELNVCVPSIVWKCPRSTYGPGWYSLEWAVMKQNHLDSLQVSK